MRPGEAKFAAEDRAARVRRAANGDRPNVVCTQTSTGRFAICSPSERACDSPSGVSGTPTRGSPFTRRSMFSTDSPCRARTNNRMVPKGAPCARAGRRERALCLNGRVATQVEELGRKPRSPDGRRLDARAGARGRARRRRPVEEHQDSRLPARARCRSRCCTRVSDATGSTPRRSTATSGAGSGTRRRARGCGPSPYPSTSTTCRRPPSEPWRFAATVEVQPTPEIVDWTTLEVPRAEADIPEELVERELDALRESVAELAPADDRPAREGDAVVVDLAARATVPVRHCRRAWLRPPHRRDRAGARGRERRRDAAGRVRAGRRHVATVEVTVKHVNEKVLPARRRRARTVGERVRHARRASRGHRAADPRGARRGDRDRLPRGGGRRRSCRSRHSPAGPLVETRARELLNGFVRSLERRGISPETYFAVSGRSPEELTAQLRAEAAQSVARELALEAVAERAGIRLATTR